MSDSHICMGLGITNITKPRPVCLYTPKNKQEKPQLRWGGGSFTPSLVPSAFFVWAGLSPSHQTPGTMGYCPERKSSLLKQSEGGMGKFNTYVQHKK